MTNRDEASEAVQRLVRTTQGSYWAVAAPAVELQERNVLFAQGLVEGYIRGLRQQSERNWEMVQGLVARAEEQSDALQTLVEESIGAYTDFLYAPFSTTGRPRHR